MIIGSGPNGLSAAVILARAGLDVEVVEAATTVGGGARTESVPGAGFRRDLGSAVHPMVFASPFFRAWEATARVSYIVPDVSFGHPLGGSRAVLAYRDLEETASSMGRDGRNWLRFFRPIVEHIEASAALALSPLLPIPKGLRAAPMFGMRVAEASSALWRARYAGVEAPALLAGVMAHANTPLPSLSAAGAAVMLAAVGHVHGWPIPKGGAQSLTDALVADIRAHGGRLTTGRRIRSIVEVSDAAAVLFDTSARDMANIVGDRFSSSYLRTLNHQRLGGGVFKLDVAVSEPVPWTAVELRRTPTVHLGGEAKEIFGTENQVTRGTIPDAPYVLLVQPSVVDQTRAEAGLSAVWAYCHVPHGSSIDMTDRILRQIERFAPGFRDTIAHIVVSTPLTIEAENPNYIGGDIASGEMSFRQVLRRPSFGSEPWRTPAPGIYLASSAASPGIGVHGMAGYHAARVALSRTFGLAVPELGLAT